MRILFTKFPLESHFGGGEKHTIQLATELQKLGHTVELLGSDPILTKEWQRNGWPYHSLNVGSEPTSPRGLLLFSLRLPITLAQFFFLSARLGSFDVVFAQSLTEKLLLTPWLLRRGIKVCWMEHLQIENWLKRNPFRWLYLALSKHVTVITVSKGVAEQLREFGVPSTHIAIIYNGIDTQSFRPKVRKNMVFQEKPLVIGTAARVVIEKDIATVLLALSQLRKEYVPFHYKIAGTGDQLETLKMMARDLDLFSRVEFVGFVKDIEAFLAQLDIFILTSYRRESFGIAVAEAMAMGIPAIVTDIPGLREVVQHEVTGLIVPPKDRVALAKAIRRLLTDDALRERMGRASRARIQANFSQERMITAFLEIFSSGSRATNREAR